MECPKCKSPASSPDGKNFWCSNDACAHIFPYNGDFCPNCGSEQITGDYIEPYDAHEAIRRIFCDDCDATWDEILTVSGFQDLEGN